MTFVLCSVLNTPPNKKEFQNFIIINIREGEKNPTIHNLLNVSSPEFEITGILLIQFKSKIFMIRPKVFIYEIIMDVYIFTKVNFT